MNNVLSPKATVSANWTIDNGVSFRMGRLSESPNSAVYLNVYINDSFIEEHITKEEYSDSKATEITNKWTRIVNHFERKPV